MKTFFTINGSTTKLNKQYNNGIIEKNNLIKNLITLNTKG